MRKPDLCFFQHVLDEINPRPSEVVMVDDKAENICAARSVGIHGVLVNGAPAGVGQTLRNLFLDPISRAETYLKNNAGNLDSVVEGRDIVIKDNFCQLMIWELTGDADIIYLRWPSGKVQGKVHGAQTSAGGGDNDRSMTAPVRGKLENGLWNYFYGETVLTTREFPPDADTTSTAYLSVPESYLSEMADVKLVLEAMASNTSPDGIMQTYFCDDRPRTSPEVCCNILRVFYRFDRQHAQSHSPPDPRIRRTEEWVIRCLKNRAYLYGSRVYSVPEAFLYFAAQLYVELGCGHDHDPHHDAYPLKAGLEPIKEALLERINAKTNPLALALRVSACQLVGLERSRYRQDLDALKSLQEEDGGWPAGHFCCTGRTGDRIGNRGLTTALAAKVIRHERV
ncbi:hypothetical protein SLS62_009965 [Diatrype stigma]|uniref:Uncharacterized protein n=1 Tax=Diatrype stigma TaxID=117547 RepID=A0AAN9YID6_9PEZI